MEVFDAVIGNPPYVRQEKIKELKPYLKKHYKTYTGVADLYVYFFEKGLNILKKGGVFCVICSNKFLKARYGEKLRDCILKNRLTIFHDLAEEKVFKKASVDTCVIQIKKENPGENSKVFVNEDYQMNQNLLKTNVFIFNPPHILRLRDKILNQGTLIKKLNIKINRGVLTGFNKAFVIDEETKNRLISEDSNNKEIIKPILRGRDIKKWKIMSQNLYLIYVPWNFNINKFPSIKEYLLNFKEKLSERPEVKKRRYRWYCMSRYAADYIDCFEKEKIIYSTIAPEPCFSYDKNNYYMLDSGFILNCDSINLKYLLGLLNSKLLFWYFKDICYSLNTKGFQYKKIFVEQLPIVVISEEKQTPFIKLVDKMLDLNNQLTNCKTSNEKRLLENQIKSIDNKIDQLVYKLYKLTDEEIESVENSLK